jgi:hypothetical protein
MTPFATYSLLWWPPVRVYLVRDLPKDRALVVVLSWFVVFVFDFAGPVVRGAFASPRFARATNTNRKSHEDRCHHDEESPSTWRSVFRPLSPIDESFALLILISITNGAALLGRSHQGRDERTWATSRLIIACANEQGRGVLTQGRSVDAASKALIGKQQETPTIQNCAAHHASRPPSKSRTTRHVNPRSVRRQEAEGNGHCVGRDRAVV